MIQIKKTILTLVALLAVTTGAWADEGTLLTTITPTGDGSTYSETTTGVVTVTPAGSFFYAGSSYGWVWDYYGSLTVTAKEGYTITKCVFRQAEKSPVTISSSPFALNFEAYLCLENYDMDGVTSIEVYGTASAAPAGPKVDGPTIVEGKPQWTFSMPGGNVELEPEYYPQAVLATGGAPTAINDVPATTDGAIVNAGTVANIDGTTTAQGTVMYYVSQTALDDAALLALDADAWTADVPTAESFTAAGTAYVYYYVRGNDSDNDDEIFSDGDILSANALTVTIAAAPTYAVTFAEGVNPEPPAEPEWTASPATDVKKGTEVTVTYTGSKKVLGVKAEKKAATPAEGKTYTNLQGGEVLHVGDKITETGGKFRSTHHENPTSTDYISLMFSNTTYEVLRADVALSGYKYEYTESPNGQYYVIKYTYYDDEDEKWVTSYFFTQDLPVTGTSDGITVTLDGQDGNQRNLYTFWVHEPNQ